MHRKGREFTDSDFSAAILRRSSVKTLGARGFVFEVGPQMGRWDHKVRHRWPPW